MTRDNCEILIRVPVFVAITLEAKNQRDIKENLNIEELKYFIDNGEYLFDEIEIDVYPETEYNPPIKRTTLEDFNNGDWDKGF